MPIPQVLLTLGPEGQIIAEVPTASGAPRKQVEITDVGQLRRLLASQLARPKQPELQVKRRIDPGAQAGQVRHWHEHQARGVKDATCPWCMADELGIDTTYEGYKRAKRALNLAHRVGDGTVKVRTIPSKSRHINRTRGASPASSANSHISMNMDDIL